ncbi:caspase family protein [Limibacter armeniacum]|uniref:caspase family protein n=1 Tax=Limibacter armeniacum TaxID=466084 RepID=UPI002FE58891
MKSTIKLFCLYLVSISCIGCATIFKGTHATKLISVDSSPDNANVYLDGRYVGRTPTRISVRQKKSHKITFEKDGYETANYYLGRHIQAGYVVLDIFALFPYGMLTDLITGAWYTPDVRRIYMNLLEKEQVSEPMYATTEIPALEVKKEEVVFTSELADNIPKTEKVNEHAVAVVIGNKNYQNKDVPNVDFALNDARLMKAYLVEAFGFREGNIIYVEDASQARFNSIFGNNANYRGQLYNYIREDESDVFIFYSGHGAPDLDKKEAYFVPVDCDPSLVALNGYSLDTFYSNLGKMPYKSLTVVLDACFSGVSDGGMLISQASPVLIKAKSRVFQDERSILFTSAGAQQVSSWFPEKQHSLFTYYFLKGLQGDSDMDGDDVITLGEMQEYLFKEVTYRARRLHNRMQVPDVVGDEKLVLLER